MSPVAGAGAPLPARLVAESVNVTAPYFSWSTKPCSASLRMDSEAVLADTPILSASILVLTLSCDHSWAVQMTFR